MKMHPFHAAVFGYNMRHQISTIDSQQQHSRETTEFEQC